MLDLYITEGCIICCVVLNVVKAIVKRHQLELKVHGEQKDIPAYPALLYDGRLLIGEGIPAELSQILEGRKS